MARETPDFPRIVAQSKRQMKDVQLVAELLLLIENGPHNYSQEELDEIFAARDEQWEDREAVEQTFRAAVTYTKELLAAVDTLRGSRMRNQVDYYSLIGAIVELLRSSTAAAAAVAAPRLESFAREVDSAAG